MESHLFIEMVKNVGFPAVIFAIWYLYHKSQVRILQEMLEDQRKREQEAFKIFNSFLETLEYHAARLSSIETKIDTNQFCPISRKEVRP